MASANITTRVTIHEEKRYVVRFRMGGRAFKQHHAGSFKTLKEARARRDWILGEIAQGRDPNVKTLFGAPEKRATFGEWAERWLDSRADVAPKTLELYRQRAERLKTDLGDRDPNLFTRYEIQSWINECGLAPRSVPAYAAVLKMILDFADVEPNPARDRRVKLPRVQKEAQRVPGKMQVRAIVENVRQDLRLLIGTLEQTALRSSELLALRWGDIDWAEQRFLITSGKTNSATRWVPVPEAELEAIDALLPPDDRASSRLVFPNISRHQLQQAMDRACKNAGIPHFHPHDLRHRRCSIWVQEGVPITKIVAWTGHSKKAMTLDTYSHVMLDESGDWDHEVRSSMYRSTSARLT